MAVNIRKDKVINTLGFGRIPPQALELEEAVIAACMLEKNTFETAMEVITSHECFYKDTHQKIWRSMVSLHGKGTPVDLLTITEELRKSCELEAVGGEYALTMLSTSVLSSAHVEAHARIVVEKYKRRELIRICGEVMQDAYEDSTDVFDLLDIAEQDIKEISSDIISSSATNVGDTYIEILQDIEAQKSRKSDLVGVTSGYDELDRLTGGWQPSELIILAARPSLGKTAAALNFALNALVPVLVFSLEALKKPLVKRMAACKNKVSFENIRRGILDVFEEDIMNKAIGAFRKLPVKIDDRTQSLSGIIKVCRREKKKNPQLGLIIIDYLQLINMSREKTGNREQEVGKISRDLKLLASELEVPIIALSVAVELVPPQPVPDTAHM